MVAVVRLPPRLNAVTRALEVPRDLPSRAPSGQQARELQSYRSLDDHPGWQLTPSTLLAAYLQAEAGDPRRQCKLFDDVIENDGALRSMFEGRAQAVAGKPRVVQASNGSTASRSAAAVLDAQLKRQPMMQIIEHLLSFNKYGYAAAETVWGTARVGNRLWIVPKHFLIVPNDRFVIGDPLSATGRIDELRLITAPNDFRGEPLIPGKWLVLDRAMPRLARGGLMRSAAWAAMGKRFAFRDWVIFSEKFGIPFTIISMPAGSFGDDEQRAIAEQMARNIGSDGTAVIDQDMKLEIHDAGRNSDNSSAHLGLIMHCNSEMAKTVVGSTLSSDNASGSGGSYGLGAVHAEVRWDLVMYDGARVEQCFGELAAQFMVFNGMDPADAPSMHVQVVRDQTPDQRMKIALDAKALGIPVSASQIRTEVGIREPLNDADATDPSFAAKPVSQPGARP